MIIYKITNKLNGMLYIGQTICSLKRRWSRHCCCGKKYGYISNAIRKYGPENFTVEHIDIASTREELDMKEIYWIKELNTVAPNGYNLTSGGEHPISSDEMRKRISEGCSHRTKEQRERYRLGQLGRKLSEETKKKMSASHKEGYLSGKRFPAMKGKPAWNRGIPMPEEVKRKVRLTRIGKVRVFSEETRRKLSLGMKGKKHTEETRLKMMLSAKKRPVRSNAHCRNLSLAIKKWHAQRRLSANSISGIN